MIFCPLILKHASPKNTNILLIVTVLLSHLRRFTRISYQLIFSSYLNSPVVLRMYFIAAFLKNINLDFPGGAVVKNPPANARDTGLSPGPVRSHTPQSN